MKDVCGDCGKSDPAWASLNKGILLCQECCGVHRSIGRHVSWVRSLHQGWWSPTLLMMVEALNAAGANSIWEYSLLDQTTVTSGCRPSGPDNMRSNKEDFIKSKHEDLEYILRSDQDPDGPEGLGAQLHAAARTPDLLTSLRLLSLGADANFYHEEKGSCPIHVAAKANQTLQVELLVVYGADVCRRDKMGRTPEDLAMEAGHEGLAQRLRSVRYHAVDRLMQYLCSRKIGPSGSSFAALPSLDWISGIEGNDSCREGRAKLQSITNSQFEKLLADVYDEIDRREAGSAWIGPDPTPFLPAHPELSATRNQGRQKLGRLSQREFDALVKDVLLECKRRDTSNLQSGARQAVVTEQSPLLAHKLRSEISDDEPLYDSVASDDDYASTTGLEPPVPVSKVNSIAPVLETKTATDSVHEDLELRRSLASSAATIARLQTEIQHLQDKVVGLMKENRHLKDEMQTNRCREANRAVEAEASVTESRLRSARPTSMYETRERLRNWNAKLGERQSVTPWPDYDVVIRRTEVVTKGIQELCLAMKTDNPDSLGACAARIRFAINELTALFPQGGVDDLISELNLGTARLEVECAAAQNAIPGTLQISLPRLRNIAYEIAKSTKLLVLRSQRQSDQLR